MAKKKYRITPVKELPERRARRETVYDDLINEFIESGEKFAQVSVENKKPATVLSGLRKRAKQKNIVVRSVQGQVYLEKKA